MKLQQRENKKNVIYGYKEMFVNFTNANKKLDRNVSECKFENKGGRRNADNVLNYLPITYISASKTIVLFQLYYHPL